MIKFLSILTIPAILLFTSCGNTPNTNDSAEEILDYKVITLTTQTATLKSNYPATIEGEQNIEIRPKIDGFIEAIYVDEGAIVKKGQRLFKINAPQYEQDVRTGKAAVDIAQASVNSAQMDVDKVRPLVEKNIISKYELESAEFNLQSQQALLAQAKATLAKANTNIGYTLITSPVNGVVGTLPYKIGSLVTSTTPLPLTTVSNITNVYAYFSINEKQLLEFGENSGNPLQKDLSSLPPASLILANGSLFPHTGRVDATSGAINTATGSIRVRATFPNPESTLRSGSSGVVVIPLKVDSAIVIPQKVTYEIQGAKFVYVIGEGNTVESRAIKVMDNHDGQFYVVRESLSKGDKIAIEGLSTLRDGVVIKPVEVTDTDILYKGIDQRDPS
ncbi:MAG TPA: efflux RND transporter periplasmic adaptor subunit [Sphingobacteriaceae bacterium]|nr:efflux RND transporter periplasmic adaptor subunit [Sphingobacteriaceae bacterium]